MALPGIAIGEGITIGAGINIGPGIAVGGGLVATSEFSRHVPG